MGYSAGQATLQIVPSLKGVADAIDAEASKWGDSAGESFSETFNARVSSSTADALGNLDGDAAEKGSSSGGAFADAFKARVDAALANLPDVDVKGNTADVDEKLAQVRADLEELSNKTIGIDISDADALAKVAEIKAALAEVGASSESIKVKVDTGEAIGELAALDVVSTESGVTLAGLSQDGESAGGGLDALGEDAGSSSAGLSALTAGLVALAVALIPIGGLAAGALAGLPSILAGAGAGFGALKLGLGGISGALSAYSTQQNSAAKATGAAGESANQEASQAISNAATIRNAANSVASAKEALANSETEAANSIHSANEQVASSEQSLQEAQYNEEQAQQALTQARLDATNQLQDYNDQLADGALQAQQDQLNLQQAQQQLTTDQGGGAVASLKAQQDSLTLQKDQASLAADQVSSSATALQIQQDQLNVQQDQASLAADSAPANPLTVSEDELNVAQATQAIKDQSDQYGQLQVTAAAANAAGVAGSSQVQGALHGVSDAQTQVQNAGQSLTDAQTAQSQAQVSAAQKVQDAQNALTNALQNQSDSLKQIALASDGGGTGGGAAGSTNAFATAMAGLTPAGRAFVTYITGTLEPQYDALKSKVQEALIPGLLTGLKAMQPVFTAIAPFIVQAATGISNFAAQLGKMLGSTASVKAITIIFQQGAGFMQQMGKALLDLLPAFLKIASNKDVGKLIADIGNGIINLAKSFANWVDNGGFQKFMNWLKANGPDIAKDIGDLFKNLGKLVIDLAPLGKILDDIVGKGAEFIGWLTKVDPLFLPMAVGLGLIAAVAIPVAAAIAAVGIPIALIVAAIVVLVAGIAELVTHWSTVWGAIKSAADDAWQFLDTKLIQPLINFFTVTIPGALDSFVDFFTALPGRVVTALGDFVNTIFADLKTIASWLDTNVWQPVSSFFTGLAARIASAVGDFFTTAWADLMKVAAWLDTNVWQPVSTWFTGLAARVSTAVGDFFTTAWADLTKVSSWLDTNVWTPVSTWFSGVASKVASIFTNFYDTAWADLKGADTWLDNNVLTPIKNFFGGLPTAIKNLAVGMWDGIADAFVTAINYIIKGWDAIQFKIPGFSLGPISFGGFTLGLPDITPLKALAAGGPATAGQPYLIGEVGPELFVPNVSGTVIPNHALSSPNNLAGSGVTYSPITHISGAADASSVAAWTQLMVVRDAQMLNEISARKVGR